MIRIRRASRGVLMILFASAWLSRLELVSHAGAQAALPDRAQLVKAKEFLEKHGGTGFSHLSFIGDKYLFYASGGDALIQYGVIRNRMITLGDRPAAPPRSRSRSAVSRVRVSSTTACRCSTGSTRTISITITTPASRCSSSASALRPAGRPVTARQGRCELRTALSRGARLGLDVQLLRSALRGSLWAELRRRLARLARHKRHAEKGSRSALRAPLSRVGTHCNRASARPRRRLRESHAELRTSSASPASTSCGTCPKRRSGTMDLLVREAHAVRAGAGPYRSSISAWRRSRASARPRGRGRDERLLRVVYGDRDELLQLQGPAAVPRRSSTRSGAAPISRIRIDRAKRPSPRVDLAVPRCRRLPRRFGQARARQRARERGRHARRARCLEATRTMLIEFHRTILADRLRNAGFLRSAAARDRAGSHHRRGQRRLRHRRGTGFMAAQLGAKRVFRDTSTA